MGLKDNLKYKRIFNLTLQNNFKIRRFLIFSIISSNPQRTHFLNYKALMKRSISNVFHSIYKLITLLLYQDKVPTKNFLNLIHV